MAAELNELLEEAAGQCSGLSDELDDTVAGIKSMVGKAGELWETLSKGGEQVRRRLKELAERLEGAETALENARSEAAGELDTLTDKAGALREDVTELMGKVRDELQQMQELQSRVDEGIGEGMQGMGTDYSDLAQKVQETQQAIDARLQQSGQAIGQFRQAVEDAHGELAEKKNAWSQALDELESEAQEQTQAWVAGLHTVLADQTTAMIDMANRMLVKHNETMEHLKTKFAVEAAQQIAASIQPLEDSLERLGELAASRGSDLSARSEEALQRVRAALPVLEEMRGVFEQSSRIG